MHVGGHHGSPPCSPTRTTTHHKLHMKESRRHNQQTYHAHNRHKIDASQKMGGANAGANIWEEVSIRATRARCCQCCVECRTLNTYLSKARYVCGCPTSLRVATGWQTNTLVCATSSVCLRTHSYGCGEEHSFLQLGPISTTWCLLDTSLAALESP
jgi:hypothetical protein